MIHVRGSEGPAPVPGMQNSFFTTLQMMHVTISIVSRQHPDSKLLMVLIVNSLDFLNSGFELSAKLGSDWSVCAWFCGNKLWRTYLVEVCGYCAVTCKFTSRLNMLD
jgi:hypothetical protein